MCSSETGEIWRENPLRATVVPRNWRYGYKTIEFPWGKNREFSYLRYPKWVEIKDGYTTEIDDIDQEPKETWPIYHCRTLFRNGNFFFLIMLVNIN